MPWVCISFLNLASVINVFSYTTSTRLVGRGTTFRFSVMSFLSISNQISPFLLAMYINPTPTTTLFFYINVIFSSFAVFCLSWYITDSFRALAYCILYYQNRSACIKKYQRLFAFRIYSGSSQVVSFNFLLPVLMLSAA